MAYDSIDARISRLAGTNGGIVSSTMLRAAGVSRPSIQRRVADGRLERVAPRSFASGARSGERAVHAALVAAGPGSAASHDTAAIRHGIWRRGHVTPIHVTRWVAAVPRLGGVRIHRSRISAAEIEVVGGVRLTSVTRTILDLGTTLTPHQLANVMYEAGFLGALDLAALRSGLARRRGARGVRIVRAALGLYEAGSSGTRSWTEDRLLAALRRAGIAMPIVNTPGVTGVCGIECDLVWPAARLVVEVDGSRGHGRPGNRVQDADRVRALQAADWRVMRVPGNRVWDELRRVVNEIQAAMAT